MKYCNSKIIYLSTEFFKLLASIVVKNYLAFVSLDSFTKTDSLIFKMIYVIKVLLTK